MDPSETRARLSKLFVIACEHVVREIFVTDGIGEPSAEIVKTINLESAEMFDVAFGGAGMALSAEACEGFATFADDELLARFRDGMRPKIAAALAPVRTS